MYHTKYFWSLISTFLSVRFGHAFSKTTPEISLMRSTLLGGRPNWMIAPFFKNSVWFSTPDHNRWRLPHQQSDIELHERIRVLWTPICRGKNWKDPFYVCEALTSGVFFPKYRSRSFFATVCRSEGDICVCCWISCSSASWKFLDLWTTGSMTSLGICISENIIYNPGEILNHNFSWEPETPSTSRPMDIRTDLGRYSFLELIFRNWSSVLSNSLLHLLQW